jgi:hypothetical protein
MSFSERQVSFLKNDIRDERGRVVGAIPASCPEIFLARIIETRAKHFGIRPEVNEVAVDLAARLAVLQSL